MRHLTWSNPSKEKKKMNWGVKRQSKKAIDKHKPKNDIFIPVKFLLFHHRTHINKTESLVVSAVTYRIRYYRVKCIVYEESGNIGGYRYQGVPVGRLTNKNMLSICTKKTGKEKRGQPRYKIHYDRSWARVSMITGNNFASIWPTKLWATMMRYRY